MTITGLKERIGDMLLGIRTYEFASIDDLHLPKDSGSYAPVPYDCLYPMLREVPPSLMNATFVDFGCGLGRVLVAASRKFPLVVGVELSKALVDGARINIKACRSECEVHCMDAVVFPIPDEAKVFFFASPFMGEPMRRVLSNIAESIKQKPREHRFLVYNRAYFEAAAEEIGLPLTRLKWVHKKTASWASYCIAQ